MKKIFAFILSLGLIIAPVPVAHANETAGYAKQILGLANGIMGGSILFKCKLGSAQASVLAYMAGSLVHVMGEVTAGQKQAKKQKSQVAQLDQTQAGGDFQKATIQAQIDDEKTTLDIIKKRRGWMLATKAVYGIATALAIMEIWWSMPYPAGIAKPENAACTPDGSSHKLLETAVILAYSSLQATGGSLKGMAVGVAMGALAKFVLKLEIGDQVADKAISLISSAYGRIGFFGAATALVVIIDADLKKEEEKSKQKIADLEKVLASFGPPETGIPEGEVTGGSTGGGGQVPPPNYAVTTLPQGLEVTKMCFSSGGNGVDYSQAGCKNPMKVPKPTFHANFNMPTLSAGANLAADLAQSIADGNMAKAEVEAGKLGSMAGRIDAINKDLLSKMNDKLKKDGKKPIDIEGELQRQVTELNNALNKNQPGSGNLSLADSKAGESQTSETKKAEEAPTTEVKAEVVAIPEPAVNVSEGDYSETPAEKVATLDEKLGDYEVSEDDISKDPGVSIFRQVSNRYLLNYTKIFPKKIVDPAEATPQNKK